MKTLGVIVSALVLCGTLRAQTGTGIYFEHGLSWEQVQAKARTEHKLIFVDVFATWCNPCKAMDHDVYPQAKVGDYMNAHFVSVKVQWDSTGHDDDQVRQWRPQAKQFEHQYHVNAFPTFLFFDADGHAVHHSLGAQSPDEFLELAHQATDPRQQYYPLRDAYQAGKRDVTDMSILAVDAQLIGDTGVANPVSRDLTKTYLPLDDERLYTKPVLTFLQNFTSSSKDLGFTVLYRHAARADSVLGQKDAAETTVRDVILREDFHPLMRGKDAKTPDWTALTTQVGQKYDTATANRAELAAQIEWADQHHLYPDLIRYNVEKIERYGVDTTGDGPSQVNEMVWDVIFEHATDPAVLNKAIKWMDLVVKASPTDGAILDTHANLLYKAGRKDEAIAEETRAVALSSGDPDLQSNLDKMKTGKPTWTVEKNG